MAMFRAERAGIRNGGQQVTGLRVAQTAVLASQSWLQKSQVELASPHRGMPKQALLVLSTEFSQHSV